MTELSTFHQIALKVAQKHQVDLDGLIRALGSRANNNGFITGPYHRFRQTAKHLLEDKSALKGASQQFKAELRANLEMVFQDSADLGYEDAAAQTEIYGLREPTKNTGEIRGRDVTQAVLAIMGITTTQLRQMELQVAVGNTDPDVVLGTQLQPRHLNPYVATKEASIWVPSLMFLAWDAYVKHAVNGAPKSQRYVKQAIAALDGFTTDTCIGVHAQIQEVNDPFILGGVFAGEKQYPPFHTWCRTVTVLVLADEVEDYLTEGMRNDAANFAQEKAKK